MPHRISAGVQQPCRDTSNENLGIDLAVPEPEAFALHKLIVCGLRKDKNKAAKDIEAAIGLLLFFEDKPVHMNRLREIYHGFPKGWKAKVEAGLKETESNVKVNWSIGL